MSGTREKPLCRCGGSLPGGWEDGYPVCRWLVLQTSETGYDGKVMQITRWKVYLWLGWTGFSTGICFLLLAIGFGAYESWFLTQSSEAQGKVIANVAIQVGTPAQNSYCPQFQYETADGITHVKTGSACSDPPTFVVGDRVRVNYLKSHPASGQIDSFGAKWGLVLGSAIAALVLTPIGMVFLNRLRSQGHSLDLTQLWS